MNFRILTMPLCSLLFLSFSVFAESNQKSLDSYSNSTEFIWLPVVFYTPETSIAAGLVNIANFWTEKPGKTSHLITTTYLTQKGQNAISLSPKFYFSQGTHELFGILKFSYFPNKFFGRIKDSALEEPENYLEKDQLLSAGFGHQFHSDFFLRGSVGLQKRVLSLDSTTPHERLQQEFQADSMSQDAQIWSLSLDWDSRDYPQAPQTGAWYKIQETLYKTLSTSRLGGVEDVRKHEIDFRNYVPINDQNTFASQIYFANLEGSEIPFSYLLSVGGNQKLRGFYAGRFLGEALLLVQLENRTDINSRWAWAQFASLGRISNTVSDLNAAENLITAGLGLHYYIDPKNRTKLRLDLGFAQAKPGFYFIFAEAF